MQHHLTPEMKKCIEACQKCHNVCLQSALRDSLEMGEKHAEPAHFRLMNDCIEICQAAANFMLRGSHFHAETCGLCAVICEACAQSCEQVGKMEDCVKACRHCAEICRKIVESIVVSA